MGIQTPVKTNLKIKRQIKEINNTTMKRNVHNDYDHGDQSERVILESATQTKRHKNVASFREIMKVNKNEC